MSTGTTQCMRCAWYLGNLTCDAFIKKIPSDIVRGFDHRSAYTGDHGYRFVDRDDTISVDDLPIETTESVVDTSDTLVVESQEQLDALLSEAQEKGWQIRIGGK